MLSFGKVQSSSKLYEHQIWIAGREVEAVPDENEEELALIYELLTTNDHNEE